MNAAVASVAARLSPHDRAELEAYLDMAAHQMRNV
jgi:hypothetical protein